MNSIVYLLKLNKQSRYSKIEADNAPSDDGKPTWW